MFTINILFYLQTNLQDRVRRLQESFANYLSTTSSNDETTNEEGEKSSGKDNILVLFDRLVLLQMVCLLGQNHIKMCS